MGMGTQTALMAVPCTKCGQLFDMSYDLGQSTAELGMVEVMGALRKRSSGRSVRCWQCRRKF